MHVWELSGCRVKPRRLWSMDEDKDEDDKPLVRPTSRKEPV